VAPTKKNPRNSRTYASEATNKKDGARCTRIKFSHSLMASVGDLARPVWYYIFSKWHSNSLLLQQWLSATCTYRGEFFISRQDIAPMHRAMRKSTLFPKAWPNVDRLIALFNLHSAVVCNNLIA